MNTQKAIKPYADQGTFKMILEKSLHFLLGVVVCRGIVFETLAPFGGSYVAAVGKRNLFWATLGTSIGYILLNPNDAFRYVAITIAIGLLRWMLQDIKKINRSILFAPLVAFVPMMTSGVVMLFVSTSVLTDFSMVLVEAVLAGAVAFFLSRALFLFNTKRRLTTLTQAEMASFIMSGCVLMLSLGGIEYQSVALGRILAVLIILLCARYGSVIGGTIAGVSTGAVFGLKAQGLGFLCGGYGFGGLIGGLFAPIGKLGVAIGFVICNSIMSFSAEDSRLSLAVFVESLIASVIFMVLPNDIEKYITPLFLPKENSKSGQSLKNSVVMRLDFASNALKNVMGSVNSVSRQLKKLYAPKMESIYENSAEEVCKSCGMRVYCWENQKNTTNNDLYKLESPLKTQGFVTENDVESLFSKKCCRSIEIADSISRNYKDYLKGIEATERVAEIRMMVAGQFAGLSEILRDMATEFENYKNYDPDTSARVTEYLHSIGLVPIECGCMLDSNGRMSVEIQLASGKVPLHKIALAKDLSSVCNRCFDTPLVTEVGTQKRVVLNEVPVYDIEVGVYQHIFNGGKLCGDCVNCFSNGFGQFVALISDGMGTGGRAAVDSNMTVSILTKLLKAGLSEDCALQVVNSALMVKSQEESLSTVDMTKIDLFTGKAYFNKAGAPLTYIKKNGNLMKKTATSLPIGILGDVKFSKEKVRLYDGDMVVMISDGALSTNEDVIEKILRKVQDESCPTIAKAIVENTIKSRNDGHDDDITAVVIRLIDNN